MSFIVEHLNGRKLGRFPVWMMRQAGRYLPNYQAIRKQHSFWESVLNPEIAQRITLTPLEFFPVDGIILFSDILTLPFGMGVPVEMRESVGPVTQTPFRSLLDFTVFEAFRPGEHTVFVGEALKMIKEKIPQEKTLLGFAGAPWTVGSYLIEGKGSKNFKHLLTWMHENPAELSQALQKLGKATADYLAYQALSGAEVLQLFDTWISEMPVWFFTQYYRPILEEIFLRVKNEGAKVIYFAKHAQHLAQHLSELSFDVLSVDCNWSLSQWDKILGGQKHLQGNLDPILLFGSPENVRKQTRLLVQEAKSLSKPAIINLGHGLLPQTPIENVKIFVKEAQELWI